MSTPPRPPLKSITPAPDGPDAARWTAPRPVSGGRKGIARKGVVSALCPDRSPVVDTDPAPDPDPTPERPGIRIYAPPLYRDHDDGARWSKRYGDFPNAAYACSCGQKGKAAGPRRVAALVDEYAAHKHFCTGNPATPTERRTAA
ncbi:hypothetical protein [Streptomyces sp. Root264]|uniref:hypothetical protein n=1 Tax=Streptomyces sp. Root264 TaxID=1736503 RepID=UPI000B1DFD6C|nr:hypothetical protein [Streptomyces sp. Root264]